MQLINEVNTIGAGEAPSCQWTCTPADTSHRGAARSPDRTSRIGSSRSDRKRRIFWTTHGWFITLRDDDAGHTRGLSMNYADVRVVGKEVVAGPFKSRELVSDWFDTFVERHAVQRHFDDPTNVVAFTFHQ